MALVPFDTVEAPIVPSLENPKALGLLCRIAASSIPIFGVEHTTEAEFNTFEPLQSLLAELDMERLPADTSFERYNSLPPELLDAPEYIAPAFARLPLESDQGLHIDGRVIPGVIELSANRSTGGVGIASFFEITERVKRLSQPPCMTINWREATRHYFNGYVDDENFKPLRWRLPLSAGRLAIFSRDGCNPVAHIFETLEGPRTADLGFYSTQHLSEDQVKGGKAGY